MVDVFKDVGLTLFKTCTNCHRIWSGRENFLRCSDLSLIGYQPDLDNPEAGSLLFNHIAEQCGTTIAVPVSRFSDLYDGIRYSIAMTDTDHCDRHCYNDRDLSKCKAECKFAYVREILQIVKKRLET